MTFRAGFQYLYGSGESRLVRRLISTSQGRRRDPPAPDKQVCSPAASDVRQMELPAANGSLQAVHFAHKFDTKRVAGSRHTCSGASACSICPGSSPLHDQLLPSLLPGRGHEHAGEFQLFMQLTQPATQLLRTCASSAPNGSSSSRICGLQPARAPAPRAVSGRRKAVPITIRQMSKLHHLQQFCHFRLMAAAFGRSRRGSTVRPKAICRIPSYGGTARNAGTRNRPCIARVQAADVGAVEANMPAGLCSSPAIIRSSVVFPEPDGPTTRPSDQKEYPVRYRSAPGCTKRLLDIGNLNAHDAPPAARFFLILQAPLQHTL